MKQDVLISDQRRIVENGQFRGYVTFDTESGLSVRAAWRMYEQDWLLHRHCSHTYVARNGKRGAILRIAHRAPADDFVRPCRECALHRRLDEILKDNPPSRARNLMITKLIASASLDRRALDAVAKHTKEVT